MEFLNIPHIFTCRSATGRDGAELIADDTRQVLHVAVDSCEDGLLALLIVVVSLMLQLPPRTSFEEHQHLGRPCPMLAT